MVKEEDYLVSNQEILGGLKTAISRGESLKDAMMTFYQAGYDKVEIEEAAKAYLSEQDVGQKIDVTKREISVAPEKKEEIKQNLTGGAVTPKPALAIPQRVSSYESEVKKPKPHNTLTIVLILILALLLGILAAVFLFRAELVDFFNSLFD